MFYKVCFFSYLLQQLYTVIVSIEHACMIILYPDWNPASNLHFNDGVTGTLYCTLFSSLTRMPPNITAMVHLFTMHFCFISCYSVQKRCWPTSVNINLNSINVSIQIMLCVDYCIDLDYKGRQMTVKHWYGRCHVQNVTAVHAHNGMMEGPA